MNNIHEQTMKKISVVNLDKLLDNFSEIEKKISEINEANNLLVLQLEKCNRLLTLSQSKEESVKEECAALQNVINGLTQTIENQCNVKDENDRLKGTIHILEEKLKAYEQFNAKLAQVQNKTTKSFSDASVLPQSVYRRKLQHLQEEKNKEIEVLQNTIRDLEQRLNKGQDLHLKRRRF